MKAILFLVCVLLAPLSAVAKSESVTKGQDVLSLDTEPDTNTADFINKLDGLGKDQKIRDRLKNRHKKKRKINGTGSSYGRGSRAKVGGRASPNTIESPGASIGGD